MSIKECRTSIELFERLIHQCGFSVADQKLWLINPHYKQKFHLAPRLLPHWVWKMKYIRNFFTTSCWYILNISHKQNLRSLGNHKIYETINKIYLTISEKQTPKISIGIFFSTYIKMQENSMIGYIAIGSYRIKGDDWLSHPLREIVSPLLL